MDQPVAPRPATSPSLAERRAAAARRRLVLTVTLLGLSAIAWSAVPAFSLPLAVPGVVTALLGAVLVLGRRAAISAQRDQTARREGRAPVARVQANDTARATATATATATTSSARVVRGAPGARVPGGQRQRITGHAVHASQTNTRMISSAEVRRQMAADAEADRASGIVVDGDVAAVAERLRKDVPAATAAARGTDVPAASAPGADAPAADVATADAPAAAARAAGDAARKPEGGELAGFSLPRPTYTMKPAAPRREVAPLEDADVTTPMTARSAEPAGTSEDQTAEPATSTEGLGLNLNQILARRRASGQ